MNLEHAGIEFVAADMPFANRLTVGVMALVADEERRAISARTKAALAVVKAKGERKLGGWRRDKAGNDLTRAPTAAEVAKSVAIRRAKAAERSTAVRPVIAELQSAGATSLGAIAEGLMSRGVPTARGGATWTRAGVSRVLRPQQSA